MVSDDDSGSFVCMRVIKRATKPAQGNRTQDLPAGERPRRWRTPSELWARKGIRTEGDEFADMERITFNKSVSGAVLHAWATEFNRTQRHAPKSAPMPRLRF